MLGGVILVCLVLGIAFAGMFAYWNLRCEIEELKRGRRISKREFGNATTAGKKRSRK